MQFLAIAAGLCLILLVAWQLSPSDREPARNGLSAAQTVAGLVAILLGIGWYLVARPDAPRVELGISATAYRLDYPKVLVRAAMTMKNDGRAVMHLDDRQKAAATFWVFRVTPFDPASVEQELSGPAQEGQARTVPFPRFGVIRRDTLALNNMLETGEPDSLGYYTILDCDSEQRVLVRATMPKPLQWYEQLLGDKRAKDQVWTTETLLDLTPVCSGKAPEGGGG